MSHYFHACVFSPYEDCSGIVRAWEPRCSSLLVVQHPAEGKTKRVHCHFLIETMTAGENWFRDKAKEVMGEYIKRGNYWLATRVQKGEHAGKLISRFETLKYLTRKDFPVVFEKNFSPAELEEARTAWVDPVKDDTNSTSPTDFMIKKVMSRYEHYTSQHSYIEHYRHIKFESSNTVYHGYDDYAKFLLDEVRTTTMKTYYVVNQRMPHASQYKIVAGTVFIQLCERFNWPNNGFEVLKNLWY